MLWPWVKGMLGSSSAITMLGVVDGRVQGLHGKPQAVFAGVGMLADLHDDHFGLVFLPLADQAFDIGQGAGQVKGLTLVGGMADAPPENIE